MEYDVENGWAILPLESVLNRQKGIKHEMENENAELAKRAIELDKWENNLIKREESLKEQTLPYLIRREWHLKRGDIPYSNFRWATKNEILQEYRDSIEDQLRDMGKKDWKSFKKGVSLRVLLNI